MAGLRTAHMGAELAKVIRGATHTHQVLRSRVMTLFLATLVLDVIATGLMFWWEHDAKGSGFDDLGGALFWVSAQLTTVSSSLDNPVTTPGRMLDIVLQVWAISVVATLAGSLAAFFHVRHAERQAQGAAGSGSHGPT